jgi:hypothetical protein
MKNEKTSKGVAAIAASMLSNSKGIWDGCTVLVVPPKWALGIQELFSVVDYAGNAVNLGKLSGLQAVCASALTQTPDRVKASKKKKNK